MLLVGLIGIYYDKPHFICDTVLEAKMVYRKDLLDYKVLYQYIIEQLYKTETTYVFLGEIQMVSVVVNAVDWLLKQK